MVYVILKRHLSLFMKKDLYFYQNQSGASISMKGLFSDLLKMNLICFSGTMYTIKRRQKIRKLIESTLVVNKGN